MAVTRTIEIKLGPDELAELFCELTGDRQALFFANIHDIAKDWPGAGWCQQSCDIARHIEQDGREVITKLAEHVLCYDELIDAMSGVVDILGRVESNASGSPEWDDIGPRIAKFRAAIAKAES
ncbi:hypothetical protein [Novosphingobium sp. JCM 18896]|uniref:hypothetical protein n=1 Tax=Novosphingobium sp. JCM 18896 TaxID=2989731 RepID=UPI002223C6B1|nr:hypothetical protein [Novosphingobium sp. JCM 18896]MCW1431358.1 hypothetical protein [Novosphingobium sp. JCM 18896]